MNDTTAPGAPRQLQKSGATGTTVTLAWNPPTSVPLDLLGYYVYRRPAVGSDPYVRVNTVPVTGLALTDVGLNCGTPYAYYVRAVDTASNESANSGDLATETTGCGGSGDGGGRKHGNLLLNSPEGDPAGTNVVAGIAQVIAGDGVPAIEAAVEAQPDSGAYTDSAGAEPPAEPELVQSPHESVGQSTGDWVGYTLHTDHLGSIRLVTGASGQVISRHTYLPFGHEIGPLTKTPTTHKFTGHERDPEINLDYMFARYYSAAMGRFVSVDSGKDRKSVV